MPFTMQVKLVPSSINKQIKESDKEKESKNNTSDKK